MLIYLEHEGYKYILFLICLKDFIKISKYMLLTFMCNLSVLFGIRWPNMYRIVFIVRYCGLVAYVCQADYFFMSVSKLSFIFAAIFI